MMYTVADLMTTELTTVTADTPAYEAAGLMARHHIRHLPVVDAQQQLIGIVSHRDLLAIEPQAMSTAMCTLMTRRVRTISPANSLYSAARLLGQHTFGALPVVDAQGQLCGIITDSDFVNIAANLLEQLDQREPEEVF